METEEAHAVPPERGVNAEAVPISQLPQPASETERKNDSSVQRRSHAPSLKRNPHADKENAESAEYVMYEGEDTKLPAPATYYGDAKSLEFFMHEGADAELPAPATDYGIVESPEFVMYEGAYVELPAMDSGNAESLEHDMHEGASAELPALASETLTERAQVGTPEFVMSEGACEELTPSATAAVTVDGNAESPECIMYEGAYVELPASPTGTVTRESNAESPECVMHEGADAVLPETISDVTFEATPVRVTHAVMDAALLAQATETSTTVPARGPNGKTDLGILLPLAIEKVETATFDTAARSMHTLADMAQHTPASEAETEEATAETLERDTCAESPGKKGERHRAMPERSLFSELVEVLPAEGASHEEYMEAWLKIDASAAGEELMRLLEEDEPPETTEQSVVSDESYAPAVVCQPSSSSNITLNSNEESGCSSFSDWNATAIATVDLTGEVPILVVAEPYSEADGEIEGVDCEWSDSALACLYEDDEDGEVITSEDGQGETSSKV